MRRSYSKKRERNAAKAKSANRPLVLTVHASPLDPTRGLLRFGTVVFPCALGRTGISARKHEGDGATPLSPMRVLGGYFRRDGAVGTACAAPLGLVPIKQALGWCDTQDDRNYNRPVRLPYPAGHEKMMREDGLYDVCVVLDWNIRPRRRGLGSAIFLHIARPGFAPTEGCIAVTPQVMRRLLPHLTRAAMLCVLR